MAAISTLSLRISPKDRALIDRAAESQNKSRTHFMLDAARVAATDDLSFFDCGVRALNDWLNFRAKSNQRSGASRTYVSSDGGRIIAFYCLAAGSIRKTNLLCLLKANCCS